MKVLRGAAVAGIALLLCAWPVAAQVDPPAPPRPSPTASPQPAHAAPVQHPRLLTPAPGSREFTLATPALTVTDLAFAGISTVTSGTATLTVLRFTAGSASLSGFTESEPCISGTGGAWHLTHSVPGAATASFSGPVTLDATSFSYTPSGGPTVTFDAANLPPLGTLVGSGTLPSVEITATSLTAAAMTAAQLSVSVSAC